jgi:molybdenum cofactor cytidylyltransferase
MISSEVGIIILAAGASTRMGQSKQLLLIDAQPLLVKTIKTALTSQTHCVVVLGANERIHRNAIAHIPIEIVFNEHWENGMGSSLKTGLNFLLAKFPAMNGVVVLVCDQPFLAADHIQKLIETHRQTRKPIVASRYANTSGVPVFFSKEIFQQLLELTDDQGAKAILHKNEKYVHLIDFPLGSIDLDTPEEYDNFQKMK